MLAWRGIVETRLFCEIVESRRCGSIRELSDTESGAARGSIAGCVLKRPQPKIQDCASICGCSPFSAMVFEGSSGYEGFSDYSHFGESARSPVYSGKTYLIRSSGTVDLVHPCFRAGDRPLLQRRPLSGVRETHFARCATGSGS